MTSRFSELIIDCHDPESLAQFWCGVLGYEVLDREEGIVEIGSWNPTAQAFREAPQPPPLDAATAVPGESRRSSRSSVTAPSRK